MNLVAYSLKISDVQVFRGIMYKIKSKYTKEIFSQHKRPFFQACYLRMETHLQLWSRTIID